MNCLTYKQYKRLFRHFLPVSGVSQISLSHANALCLLSLSPRLPSSSLLFLLRHNLHHQFVSRHRCASGGRVALPPATLSHHSRLTCFYGFSLSHSPFFSTLSLPLTLWSLVSSPLTDLSLPPLRPYHCKNVSPFNC